MIINIITLHRAQNYGSVLQAFALQKKLDEMGNNSCIPQIRNRPHKMTQRSKR